LYLWETKGNSSHEKLKKYFGVTVCNFFSARFVTLITFWPPVRENNMGRPKVGLNRYPQQTQTKASFSGKALTGAIKAYFSSSFPLKAHKPTLVPVEIYLL
jgi:hypothetical protein